MVAEHQPDIWRKSKHLTDLKKPTFNCYEPIPALKPENRLQDWRFVLREMSTTEEIGHRSFICKIEEYSYIQLTDGNFSKNKKEEENMRRHHENVSDFETDDDALRPRIGDLMIEEKFNESLKLTEIDT